MSNGKLHPIFADIFSPFMPSGRAQVDAIVSRSLADAITETEPNRLSDIKQRLFDLDDTKREDWMSIIDTVLHHDLPWLITRVEELENRQ